MSLVEISAAEQRLASRVDGGVTSGLSVSNSAGGLSFRNAGEAMEFAKLMALSQVAVPKHLRGNPGACLAVVIQAIEWRLSPYAVANKSYSVNDRLAYESQLIQAVILQRAPIKGRFRFYFSGSGVSRKCKVEVTTNDGEVIDYESPEVKDIPVKNSPLWKSDPDQQLTYYSGRAMCRRHFPDVLLGVYDRDEIEEQPRDPSQAKNVTPSSLTEKLDALAKPTGPAEVSEDGSEVYSEEASEEQSSGMPLPHPPLTTSDVDQIFRSVRKTTSETEEKSSELPPEGQDVKTMDEHDAALADAAKGGTDALQMAWNALPADVKSALKAALDRRHKPAATQADNDRLESHK